MYEMRFNKPTILHVNLKIFDALNVFLGNMQSFAERTCFPH